MVEIARDHIGAAAEHGFEGIRTALQIDQFDRKAGLVILAELPRQHGRQIAQAGAAPDRDGDLLCAAARSDISTSASSTPASLPNTRHGFLPHRYWPHDRAAEEDREVGSPSSRHCEPTGRAKRRPMTGSAKQSMLSCRGKMDCFVASLLAMTGLPGGPPRPGATPAATARPGDADDRFLPGKPSTMARAPLTTKISKRTPCKVAGRSAARDARAMPSKHFDTSGRSRHHRTIANLQDYRGPCRQGAVGAIAGKQSSDN